VAGLRGFKYLFDHPRLLKLALPPALISGLLLAGLLTADVLYTRDLIGLIWSQPASDAWYQTWLLLPLWYLLWLVVASLLGVMGVVGVYLLSIPLAGPFYELLSEKVEANETGFVAPWDLSVMVRNLAITALHVGLFLSLQILVFAVVTAIGFIPVAGQIIAAVLSFFTSPLLIGFLPFDYPMTVRLWTFREKLAFMWRHFSTFFGFSLAAFLMLYVPFVNLLFLPACVAAATLILIERERAGELTIPDRRKALLIKKKRVSAEASVLALPVEPENPANADDAEAPAAGDSSGVDGVEDVKVAAEPHEASR
jgi:CysZ protein